ncbi:GNAT family N-acetyltransferase [soil metagenome]
MRSSITIRPALVEDSPAIMGLIRALAEFEKAPEQVLVSEEDIVREGFGTDPIFKVHVAEEANEVVGIALFYTGYSTWKGRMIYLDDLVVHQQYRGRGIGTQLLESVFEYARQTKANLIKWQVLDWNEPAIEFYKKYPVQFGGEWLNCRIMTEALTTTHLS